MNKWGMKGIVLGLCLSMMAPMAVAMVPGISVEATEGGANAGSGTTGGSQNTGSTELDEAALLKKAKTDARKELNDYKRLIDPDGKYTDKLNEKINKAMTQINSMDTATGVTNYVSKAKAQMDAVVNPPKDDSKDDKDDKDDNTTVPVNADHFLTVGGNWVTPVANAGTTGEHRTSDREYGKDQCNEGCGDSGAQYGHCYLAL